MQDANKDLQTGERPECGIAAVQARHIPTISLCSISPVSGLSTSCLPDLFAVFARDRSGGIGDGVVAIDGKALRRSFGSAPQHSPLHLVQAFAVHFRLVPGQVKVDGRSNGITAMPALLDLLDPEGSRGALHEDVRLCMEDPEGFGNIDVSGDGVEAVQGRVKTRSAAVRRDVGRMHSPASGAGTQPFP